MTKIPSIISTGFPNIIDITPADFSKLAAFELAARHPIFGLPRVLDSTMQSSDKSFTFEMKLNPKEKSIIERCVYLLKNDDPGYRHFHNLWESPSRVDRFHDSLTDVFNGTNLKADAVTNDVFELLLNAATSKLFSSQDKQHESENYYFDNNVFMQLNRTNGELDSVHIYRGHRFFKVDFSAVSLNNLFAAIGKIYKPTIISFNGYLRNYYSGKYFCIDIESDRGIVTRQLPLPRT